ncbi:lipid A deacylase LpxR family protein [Desulfocurvus sp. DL9XJH121]
MTEQRPAAWRFLVLACALAVLALAAPAPSARADEPEAPGQSWSMSFYEENDMFGGTDQHYTNAFKLSILSKDLREYAHSEMVADYFPWLIPLIRQAPFVNDPGTMHNIGLSIGNDMYTPVDTHAQELIEDDRPYAGWSYLSLALHAKNAARLDTFELSLGVVGPSAHSELVQDSWHDLINKFRSGGWEHQIHDEPALMATWQRSLREEYTLSRPGWSADVIPHFGAALGNVYTYANAGGQVRLGYHLPQDFGVSLLRPGASVPAPAAPGDPRLNQGWGWNVFLGAEGRAVARNIFLDGNTWRSSHHVTKKPLVGDLYGGVSLIMGRCTLTYTHVLRSEEFDGQKDPQIFGSMCLSWSF